MNNNKIDRNNLSISHSIQRFDPLQLQTIELAAFVLGLLRKGVTTIQLAESLECNYNLTGAFLRLFDELKWIEMQGDRWILTNKGIENLGKFQEQ